MIISDVLLIGLFFYVMLKNYRFSAPAPNRVNGFIIMTVLYFLVGFLSIINAVDYPKFFNAQMPFAFTFLLLFVSYKVISADPDVFFLKLRKTIIYAILFINIPAYLSFVGLRLEICFDPARYQSFTYNPNQYNSFILIAIFLLILLEAKFQKGDQTVLMLIVYSVLPVLLSGSKTGIIILLALLLFLMFRIFSKINFVKKGFFLLLLVLLIQILIPLLDDFRKSNWSVDRAIKTYDIVMGNEKVDKSTESRYTQAVFGRQLLEEHPLLGIGLGNFTVYFEENEVHNTFLSTLYECGILGFMFLMFLLIFIVLAILSSSLPRKMVLTAFLCLMLFFAMNTFHILFRERWVWFYFICLMFLFSNRKPDSLILKSETK